MLALLGALLIKLDRAEEAERPLRRRSRRRRRSRNRTRISASCWFNRTGCTESAALPRAGDASRSQARKCLVRARQGARRGGPWGRGRSCVREVFRALARAPLDGACGRTSEGGPARGGRASLSARPASASRATSMRMSLLAFDRPASRATTRPGGKPAQKRPVAWRRIFSRRSWTSAACARNRTAIAEALECFDRAIALDATNAQAHFLRGATLAPAAFTHEAIDGIPALPRASLRTTSAR